jgi:hypothetical protein
MTMRATGKNQNFKRGGTRRRLVGVALDAEVYARLTEICAQCGTSRSRYVARLLAAHLEETNDE